MAELKPCPFCGRAPTVDDCGDHRYFVRCKCGIAQDKLYAQKCDAIRRWNTRKTTLAAAQPTQLEIDMAYMRGKVDGIRQCTEKLRKLRESINV